MCMARDALVAAVPPPVLIPSALSSSHKKNLVLLQAAMKYAPNRWMFQRYQAVALVLKGYPYAAVSEIIGNRISLRPGRPPRGTGGIKTSAFSRKAAASDYRARANRGRGGYPPDPARRRLSGGNEWDGAAGAALHYGAVGGHVLRTWRAPPALSSRIRIHSSHVYLGEGGSRETSRLSRKDLMAPIRRAFTSAEPSSMAGRALPCPHGAD